MFHVVCMYVCYRVTFTGTTLEKGTVAVRQLRKYFCQVLLLLHKQLVDESQLRRSSFRKAHQAGVNSGRVLPVLSPNRWLGRFQHYLQVFDKYVAVWRPGNPAQYSEHLQFAVRV